MEYGSHFRLVVEILDEDSYEIDFSEYFMNESVFRVEDDGTMYFIDISGEMDASQDIIIECLREDKGIGCYEIFGEIWVNYYQTWTDYGYEHDVDFEMRNETIIELPKGIESMSVDLFEEPK